MSAVPRIVEPPPKVTALEVKDALRRRHPEPTWVCIEEAFSGYANMCGGIDLLAIGVWRSAHALGLPGAGRYNRSAARDARNPLVGYEVKVSRSDFRRELYGYRPGAGAKSDTRPVPPWPGKVCGALELVHYFAFATPRGLLHPDEIERRVPWRADAPRPGALYVPEGIGLVEIDARGCFARVDATLRQPRAWTRHETAEIVRRASYTAAARARAEAVRP